MDGEAMAAAIGAGSSLLMFVAKEAVESYKEKRKSKRSLTKIVQLDHQIDRSLFTLMEQLQADRAFICRFHNGTAYANGVPMEKFSMSNEVFTSASQSGPLSSQFQGRLVSEFAAMMQKLTLDGSVGYFDLSKEPPMSKIIPVAKKSLFLYSIEHNGEPSAFLGICFDNQHLTISEGELDLVVDRLTSLRTLLTLKAID